MYYVFNFKTFFLAGYPANETDIWPDTGYQKTRISGGATLILTVLPCRNGDHSVQERGVRDERSVRNDEGQAHQEPCQNYY